MSETRTRFLREIAARVPAERLVEIHLFPPMRQGAIESGIAVVAAVPEDIVATVPEGQPEQPAANDAAPQMAMDEILAGGEPACATDVAGAEAGAAPIVRHTVYTARYRATLKGADRGKWEFFLVAEADAPLVSIDAVVRGVQRRSADAAEPERLTPESLEAAAGGAWAIPPA